MRYGTFQHLNVCHYHGDHKMEALSLEIYGLKLCFDVLIVFF